MSVGSFFGFNWGAFPAEGDSQEEAGVRRLLTTESPSEIAQRMIRQAPEEPHIQFVRDVYPVAASGGEEERPLSEHQKRTYDTTLDLLGEHRKRSKNEAVLNKIDMILPLLNSTPELIKKAIVDFFPDDGEVSSAAVFLESMKSKVRELSRAEKDNYYRALSLILDQNLETNIAIEILKQHGKDDSFLNEDANLHYIAKAIKFDLQEVFSLLIENINDTDRLKVILHDLVNSSFQIHPEDLKIFIDNFVVNAGFLFEHGIDVFIQTVENHSEFFNCHLTAQLLLLSENASEKFQRITQKLCKDKKFKSAQDLIDLIGNEIKKTKTRQGTLSAIYEQLSYVVGYAKYNMLSYSKMEFPGCSEAEMKEVFTKDSFDSFKEKLDRSSLESVARWRAASSKAMPLEKMQQKGVPLTIKQNPAFEEFIQKSGVFQAVSYYKHGWARGRSGGEQLLVNGQYRSAEEVLRQFELKEIKLGPKMIYGFFDKATGQRWCYLENGLTLHDPTKSFIPIKKVEGDGTYSISFVTTDHGGTTSHVGIKRLCGSHAWLRMQDQEGNVYSAGKWGNGLIASPDYTEYESVHTVAAKVTLTAEQFAEVKREIERQQREAKGEFSILTDNCSEFSAGIAKMLFPAVSPEATLDVLDTTVNHLKYYYGACEVVKGCFANKEKIKEVLERIETGQVAIKIMDSRFIKGTVGDSFERKEKPKSALKRGASSAFSNPTMFLDMNKYFDLPGVQKLHGQMDHIFQQAQEIAPAALTAAAATVGFQIPVEDMVDFSSTSVTQVKTIAERGSAIREKISKIDPKSIALDHFLELAGMDRDALKDTADEAVRSIKKEAFEDFKRFLHALPDSNEKQMILIALKALEENVDPEMIAVINDKIKAILKAVSVYLDTNNEAALIDSIFNLCLNFAKVTHGFTLNHPYTLFESLSKEKGVQVLREKPRA